MRILYTEYRRPCYDVNSGVHGNGSRTVAYLLAADK